MGLWEKVRRLLGSGTAAPAAIPPAPTSADCPPPKTFSAAEAAALVDELRRAGHKLGPLLPLEELFQSIPAEQLDHLVYALYRAGSLARLTPPQVDSILHALRQAHPALVPAQRKQRLLTVDIVGTCNLRCPSCPVENVGTNPSGLMSLDLFARIVDKARREFA